MLKTITARRLITDMGEIEYPVISVENGNIFRIEGRERNDHAVRIGFDGNFIRLADVDQEIAPLRRALGYFRRRQIVHLMVRHTVLPTIHA